MEQQHQKDSISLIKIYKLIIESMYPGTEKIVIPEETFSGNNRYARLDWLHHKDGLVSR